MSGRGLTIDAVKGTFFDSEAVLNATDKATRSKLSRFGARVRQRSKTSIKYKKGVSPAGGPPHGHRSVNRSRVNKKGETVVRPVSLLREGILFGYIVEEKTVAIGPVISTEAKYKPTGSQTIPELIAKGGNSVTVTPKGKRPAKYRPRPFMPQAFEAEVPDLMDSLKDSVK